MGNLEERRVIKSGARQVTPLVYKLHALHYPEKHREPFFFMYDSNDATQGVWIPSTEIDVASPSTTIRRKSEAIGLTFRAVGASVEALHPRDNVQGLYQFCRSNLDEEDRRDLEDMQEVPFSLEQVMPPDDVVRAMFRNFTELHRSRCAALEHHIGGLAIGAGQQLTLWN